MTTVGAWIRGAADVNAPGSLASRNRQKRFAQFERLLGEHSGPVRILDIGGTNAYWAARGLADDERVEITLANHIAEPVLHPNIRAVTADASDLAQFDDMSFDIVFSNSTIEHLFTREAQSRMAHEVRRLAPEYYVQTPNFWFPVEPHFLFPAWQWLPTSLRVALLRKTRVGHRGPYPQRADARRSVDEIRLLTRGQLCEMFPDATIVHERLGPLTKSFVAIRSLKGPKAP